MVGTTNRSMSAMFGARLRRKVSQRCKGGPRRLAADEGFTGFNGSLERAIGVRADITQARRFDMTATIRACKRDGKTTWPCASSDAIHPQETAVRTLAKFGPRNRWTFNT